MKQRTALLLAAALTAFVTIVVATLAFSISQRSLGAAIASNAAPVVEQVSAKVARPEAPAVQPVRPIVQAQGAAGSVQARLISADHAAQVAGKLLPGANLLKSPELVNYKGQMAYEVLLSSGSVYVDAFTGKVLGSVVSVASNSSATSPDTAPADNASADNAPANDPAPDPAFAPASSDAAAQVQAPAVEPPAPAYSDDHQDGGKGDKHKGKHEQQDSESHDD